MAGRVRQVRIESRGARALLRSENVRRDMDRRARNIAAAAGPGMEASSMVGTNRARASVITATREARVAEARNRNLSRALDAGRG